MSIWWDTGRDGRSGGIIPFFGFLLIVLIVCLAVASGIEDEPKSNIRIEQTDE